MAVCVAAVASSASAWGVSSQFQKQDGHGGYAYGYEDPNSQKQEQRLAGGVVQGGYSYVDGAGKVQHVKYVADPKLGFQSAGAGVPNDGRFGYDFANIRIGHGGVPIDTPEVQAARAKHLAALAEAHKDAPYQSYGNERRRRRSVPQVPIDTPEVQHAKAHHFAALHAAATGQQQSYNTGSIKHVVVPYHGPLNYPVLHKGVPVDTPEVIQARQKHYNAWGSSHAAAAAAGGDKDEGGDENEEQGGQWQGQNWGQQQQGSWKGQEEIQSKGVSQGDYYRQAPESSGYKGPIHVPVIHQGVPVEPQEVIHARNAHLTALAKAHAEAGPYTEQEENEKWN